MCVIQSPRACVIVHDGSKACTLGMHDRTGSSLDDSVYSYDASEEDNMGMMRISTIDEFTGEMREVEDDSAFFLHAHLVSALHCMFPCPLCW